MVLKNIVSKIILCLVALVFLGGAGEYKMLEENERAPFEGVLITVEALSQIQAKNEFTINSIRSECAYQNSKNILELNKKYDLLYSECDIRARSQQEIIDIKNKQILEINEIAKKNTSGSSKILWGISGVVLGSVIAVGSIFVYNSLIDR